jgi:hypothetical protein
VSLGKGDSQQARAKQHKAGRGYCEEPIRHEVMSTHGAPADRGTLISVRKSLVGASARTGRHTAPRTVKRIRAGPTIRNLTDDLEQHSPGIGTRRGEGVRLALSPQRTVLRGHLKLSDYLEFAHDFADHRPFHDLSGNLPPRLIQQFAAFEV